MRKRDGERKVRIFSRTIEDLSAEFPDGYSEGIVLNPDNTVDAQFTVPIDDPDAWPDVWNRVSTFIFPNGPYVWISYGVRYRSTTDQLGGVSGADRDRSRYLRFRGDRTYYHKGRLGHEHPMGAADLFYLLNELHNTGWALEAIVIRIQFQRSQPERERWPDTEYRPPKEQKLRKRGAGTKIPKASKRASKSSKRTSKAPKQASKSPKRTSKSPKRASKVPKRARKL